MYTTGNMAMLVSASSASAITSRRIRRLVVLGLLGFLVVGLARALRPVFISAAVDELVATGGALNFILFVLSIIALSEYICNYGRRRFTVVVIGRIVAQMRKDCFEAAIERDLAFYDRHKSGAVISRITSDTQEFGDVMLLGSEVISQFLAVSILFAALLSYSLEMTIVLFFTMPLVMFAALGFRFLARIVTRQGSRAMAIVNDNIQESVTGISVAKNFRQEEMIYNEFSAVNILSYQINLRRGFILSLVFPTMGILSAVALSIVVWVGTHSVVAGAFSAGTWYLYIQSVDRFWFPFMNLASFWSQFQQGLSAAERIFALIDAENTVLADGQHRRWRSRRAHSIRKCHFRIRPRRTRAEGLQPGYPDRARTSPLLGIPARERAQSPN